MSIASYAGQLVSIDRMDIRRSQALSVDLRIQTGDPRQPSDETCLIAAGVFSLSVFKPLTGDYPVGEIRIWYIPGRCEIRVVGHLTQREGIVEITPDHLIAMTSDPSYRQQIAKWLGVH